MIKDKRVKDIVSRLSYFRTLKNLSAREVSLRLGHCESWFYRVEAGLMDINCSTFLALLDLFEITPSEFFYYDLNKIEEDREINALIREMSKDEKMTLSKFVKIKKCIFYTIKTY